MSNLKIPLKTVLRYIKLRFIIISLIVIVSVVIIPYWMPILPDYNPIYSIHSDHEYGQSNLLPALTNYEILREHRGEYDQYAKADLVIITKPQQTIPFELRESYRELRDTKKFLFIGSEGLYELASIFSYDISMEANLGNRIFDETNNGGSLVYPKLNAFGLDDVYGVVPTNVYDYNGEQGPLESEEPEISTEITAAAANCYDLKDPCYRVYEVGHIRDNSGIVADEWMFRNKFTDMFPANIELFSLIIEELIGETGTILFEESYLEWAPVNTEGVENFISVQLNVGLILLLVFLIGLLLPFIIGVQANVFGPDDEEEISDDFKNLERRLDFIHIEKLPSAPLNLMEKTLMDDRLKYEIRGKYYFQYVARNALEFIDKSELNNQFPSNLKEELRALTVGVFPENSSWRVLEKVYQKLLSITTENR